MSADKKTREQTAKKTSGVYSATLMAFATLLLAAFTQPAAFGGLLTQGKMLMPESWDEFTTADGWPAGTSNFDGGNYVNWNANYNNLDSATVDTSQGAVTTPMTGGERQANFSKTTLDVTKDSGIYVSSTFSFIDTSSTGRSVWNLGFNPALQNDGGDIQATFGRTASDTYRLLFNGQTVAVSGASIGIGVGDDISDSLTLIFAVYQGATDTGWTADVVLKNGSTTVGSLADIAFTNSTLFNDTQIYAVVQRGYDSQMTSLTMDRFEIGYIPEPSSLALLGLAALALLRHRGRRG